MNALYTLFAVHYVFNHPRLKDFFQFLEDKVVGINSGTKKSAVYLNVATAAECYLPQQDSDQDWFKNWLVSTIIMTQLPSSYHLSHDSFHFVFIPISCCISR